ALDDVVDRHRRDRGDQGGGGEFGDRVDYGQPARPDQAGQGRYGGSGVLDVLGDHAHGDEVEPAVGAVILQHALRALVHDLVVADVVARIDTDQETTGRSQMARAFLILREHVAPAAHVEPIGL